ncbi:MAG TPA: hypothetical protein VL178_00250 [Pseudomonas sp.]|jgi:hypothetical protein|nr:hypothetical protein [Pseudomonas sp.]
MRPSKAAGYLVRHPSALLLLIQPAGITLYPWMDNRVLGRTLFGVFGLLAWSFAFLYNACQILIPHSFGAAIHPELPRSWMELLYLSRSAAKPPPCSGHFSTKARSIR